MTEPPGSPADDRRTPPSRSDDNPRSDTAGDDSQSDLYGDDPRIDTPGDGTRDDDSRTRTAVGSRWWYWIAAVPIYFALSLVFGAFFVGVFLLGLVFDAGAATGALFLLGVLGFVLPGVVLSVLFPLALYVDAQAVSESAVDWDPDPLLYALIGLAGVLVTAFTVSVPLAIYYLYRRHGAVGVP